MVIWCGKRKNALQKYAAVTNVMRSEVQISGRSNQTQCCQRLATAATFLRKELCCPGAMTRRWAPPTRYTLRRNAASIMKDLIWFDRSKTFVFAFFEINCLFKVGFWLRALVCFDVLHFTIICFYQFAISIIRSSFFFLPWLHLTVHRKVEYYFNRQNYAVTNTKF